jgi:uncharacterized protein YbjQ (UPF0145 family)
MSNGNGDGKIGVDGITRQGLNRGNMPDGDAIKFECSHCGQSIEATAEMGGMDVACPTCGKTGKVPQQELEQASPQPTTQRAIDACRPSERYLFIITTTSNEISGCSIEKYLGIARGVVVRSPDAAQSLFGGLKQIVGGNIESYAKVCDAARQEAFSRMVQHANTMKADAIIAFRYDATEFSAGVTEVLAYGTAVKLSEQLPS